MGLSCLGVYTGVEVLTEIDKSPLVRIDNGYDISPTTLALYMENLVRLRHTRDDQEPVSSNLKSNAI